MHLVTDGVQQLATSDEFAYDRTGPGTTAGRYMRQYWMPVALSIEIAPGRAKTIQVLSEKFTLYRGVTGAAHLVANYCAHRNTILGTGWVEGEEIRCFYHGWKYDGSGQCTELQTDLPARHRRGSGSLGRSIPGSRRSRCSPKMRQQSRVR